MVRIINSNPRPKIASREGSNFVSLSSGGGMKLTWLADFIIVDRVIYRLSDVETAVLFNR